MNKSRLTPFSLFLIVMIFSAIALADQNPCSAAIPPGGLYDIMRSWSYSDFQLAIDDYVYQKQYKTHDEAVADGFSLGTRVYGVPLEVGKTFSQAQRDQWMSEYQSRSKRNLSSLEKKAFESLKLNNEAIKAVTECIMRTTAYGLGSSLTKVDDCTVVFSAWYKPNRNNDKPPEVAGGRVVGGACTPWPAKVISFASTDVACVRSGRERLIITLDTIDSGSASQTLESLSPLGPEPKSPATYEVRRTRQASKTFTVNRPNWVLANDKIGGGDYVYYDVSPDEPGSVQSISIVSCSGCGGHLWLCPDGGVCKYQLFEKRSDSVMRIWAHLDSSDATTTTFTLSYLADQRVCTANCNFDVEHAAWQAENARTCGTVAMSSFVLPKNPIFSRYIIVILVGAVVLLVLLLAGWKRIRAN